MGDEKMNAVLDDYRSAPIDERLRATLAFLEKMTLSPEALTPADADAARAAGATDEMLEDAAQVCAAFNMITRVADALEFEIVSDKEFAKGAQALLRFGYG
jgi:alkylhydroperoxidase family enzyme